MISAADLSSLLLTFKLAAVSTGILLIISLPLAWLIAQSRNRYMFTVEALIALPLVLPPTVLGFYLLLLLSPSGVLADFWQATGGVNLLFSFSGLVIGSIIYSFPFVIQPLILAFKQLGQQPLEAAATLGASPLNRFFTVALPICKNSILSAAVLGFAHTLGEFGVVLMIGGNIPDETRVASIAIYEHVETMNYSHAHDLAALLLVISFVLLLVVYGLNRRSGVK